MSELSIQELQIKQTFLERHIEEQDKVIYEMQSDIERLRSQIKKLIERTESLSASSGDMPANERPPHY
ncbi:SlyX family protein [Pelagicoccus albus]|uniref:SlyX family protein n=1 Tax=Pelagicoccus albus TaxID=415222 RepID=A0A7X1E852_9BACT|nr:SlyX family protein [Pelagicoccus albus]MBC2605989.1 SlyX family protein [Pelagicoccus albus]